MPAMNDPNIRKLVKALGGPTAASRAAKKRGLKISRQLIESWLKKADYPEWRHPQIITLQAIAIERRDAA